MSHGFQVTFDAADPARLAEFWAIALGYMLQPPPDGFESWEEFADAMEIPPDRRNDIAAVVDPDRKHPRLLFLRVPEGKTAKNRVHLDVNAAPRDIEPPERTAMRRKKVAALAAAGATEVEEREGFGAEWTVMLDPEGNEFCVH